LFFASDGSPLSGAQDAITLLAGDAATALENEVAYQTAHSWFDANDLPVAVRSTLESDPTYAAAKLLKVFFEKPSAANAPGAGHPAVLAVVEVTSGLAVVGIASKLNEPFGDFVFQWNDGAPGRATRQAHTIGAREAAMLIQSFGSDQSPTGFADLQMLGAVLGAPISDTGILSPPVDLEGIRLRLGWSVCHGRRRE
jgi:hypothetical protein